MTLPTCARGEARCFRPWSRCGEHMYFLATGGHIFIILELRMQIGEQKILVDY